eukprot:jgi/Picre1/32679/NNA_008025.t1
MPVYTLSGVDVSFPYDAYPCQLEYMGKVIQALQNRQNALLESPTGTGKTLCLLCASLAWRDSLKKVAAEKAQQLKENRQEDGGTVQALKEDYAQYKAEQASRGVDLPTIVYSSRTHKIFEEYGDVNDTVLDIEDLVKVGENRSVCPYFLSRGLTQDADIVFMPYNYLIDSKTRSGLGISWSNAVLIFDEAHNVESVCSGSTSFDLSMGVIGGSIEEIGTAAEILSSQADGQTTHSKDSKNTKMETVTTLRQLQLVLKKLEDIISSFEIPKSGLTRPGPYILELLQSLNLNDQTFTTFSAAIEAAITTLTEDALAAGKRMASRVSSTRLFILRECLSQVFRSDSTFSTDGRNLQGYRVHIHKEKDAVTGIMLPTLSFWCFDPGEGMRALKDMQIRSILLTSGTLSPMGSFAQELGIEFPVRLENPHVIDQSQVWVGVVSKGPQGTVLNSSYKTRNDTKYIQDLGNAIVNYTRMIPDGLLVFFPSYSVMRQSIEAWKSHGQGGSSIWERISQYKAPVVEPSDASSFPTAALEFKKQLDSPAQSGAVFFGVCRGKASEGLDFSDRAGRAVVITGIPFAMMTDPKQAMRAVNQAIGRVIRHKNDYGAIILCDERFGSQRITSQLSKWLRDDVVNYPTYGAAASSLTQFFKSKSHLSKASQPVISKEHQKPRHAFAVAQRNNGSSIKSLIQNAPAAVDAIGISDLVVPVAKLAPKSIAGTKQSSDGPSLLSMMESSSSLSMSKRKRATTHKTDGTDDFLQSEKAPSDAFKPTVSKPWERTDPYPWKKHAQSQKGGNLGQLLSAHTKSTGVSAVGPSHLIEKHAASEHHKTIQQLQIRAPRR